MKKLHWTQRPENRAKVAAMSRKGARTKQTKKTAPKKKKIGAGRAKLLEYALIGAHATVERCTAELTVAKMFIASYR